MTLPEKIERLGTKAAGKVRRIGSKAAQTMDALGKNTSKAVTRAAAKASLAVENIDTLGQNTSKAVTQAAAKAGSVVKKVETAGVGHLLTKKTSSHPIRKLTEAAPLSMPLEEALQNRHSSRDFSSETIPDDILASILWACDGINRKDGKRTTPSAMNWQEIDVYVVKANGVWLWRPNDRCLEFLLDHDRRQDFSWYQPFIKGAPVHLVYVVDKERTRDLISEFALSILKVVDKKAVDKISDTLIHDACILDIGAKMQACYLACAALGINCLARLTFDRVKAATALRLNSHQEPILIQTLGFKPDSLLKLAM